MTSTEELRRLLDERGVEYEGETIEDGWTFTRWHGFDDTGWMAASDELCGLLDLRGRYLFTPEQAVEATLGRGECTLEEVDIDGMSASEYMKVREWCFDSVYRCSCGCLFGYVAHNRPNFCPNCGGKVKSNE